MSGAVWTTPLPAVWAGVLPPSGCQGMHDRLPDPPHRIGNKARPSRRVKLAGGVQQTQIALVDQVHQWQSSALVFAGNLHHEPQVVLDEILQGLFVPLLEAACKRHFFLRGKDPLAAHLGQVCSERIRRNLSERSP